MILDKGCAKETGDNLFVVSERTEVSRVLHRWLTREVYTRRR